MKVARREIATIDALIADSATNAAMAAESGLGRTPTQPSPATEATK
jgi:hypothetical protein